MISFFMIIAQYVNCLGVVMYCYFLIVYFMNPQFLIYQSSHVMKVITNIWLESFSEMDLYYHVEKILVIRIIWLFFPFPFFLEQIIITGKRVTLFVLFSFKFTFFLFPLLCQPLLLFEVYFVMLFSMLNVFFVY